MNKGLTNSLIKFHYTEHGESSSHQLSAMMPRLVFLFPSRDLALLLLGCKLSPG